MPRPHISMRKIRDVLRLRFGEGLSLRQVSASLGIPFTTVSEHVKRAQTVGVGWPLPEGLDDDALEALLFRRRAGRDAPAGLAEIHHELRRPHVTLQLLWEEYRPPIPTATATASSAELYRRWAGSSILVMRQTHRAGREALRRLRRRHQLPWSDATGEVAGDAELFVAVLGARATPTPRPPRSRSCRTGSRAHVRAFEFFGGVAGRSWCPTT